ncbi:hypothetical protein DASC09_043110 [Saccharomycopsis crataegensis]|uniref:Transposase DDE domain-containing protein n=1 Tax=Saccharomycopsis crataegensis TaxID=43959 RepID=A0AAV5QQI0_9ASCO|nr:hypothetical protein DASC09_043110 [Saccharomycopsis crataegensis]
MSGIKVRIENKFTRQNQQFSHFKYHHKIKVLLKPVSVMYSVAVLFLNIQEIMKKDDLTVEEYLRWEKV